MNAIEVVQNNNKAYNAHDADAFAATYAEGATYSNPRAGKGLTGKAIANNAKAVWAAYPDASVELITVGDTRYQMALRLLVVPSPFRGPPSLRLKGIKSVRNRFISIGRICLSSLG
jgi:ketosteroid isomerase-like protein